MHPENNQRHLSYSPVKSPVSFSRSPERFASLRSLQPPHWPSYGHREMLPPPLSTSPQTTARPSSYLAGSMRCLWRMGEPGNHRFHQPRSNRVYVCHRERTIYATATVCWSRSVRSFERPPAEAGKEATKCSQTSNQIHFRAI